VRSLAVSLAWFTDARRANSRDSPLSILRILADLHHLAAHEYQFYQIMQLYYF
jgi:hypothetical protein